VSGNEPGLGNQVPTGQGPEVVVDRGAVVLVEAGAGASSLRSTVIRPAIGATIRVAPARLGWTPSF